MGVEQEQRASLAPQYAFVVQFATDTQIGEGRIHGRVEHVVSRQAMHFTSLNALLAFMAQVLQGVAAREQEAQAEIPPAPPGGSASPEAAPTTGAASVAGRIIT